MKAVQGCSMKVDLALAWLVAALRFLTLVLVPQKNKIDSRNFDQVQRHSLKNVWRSCSCACSHWKFTHLAHVNDLSCHLKGTDGAQQNTYINTKKLAALKTEEDALTVEWLRCAESTDRKHLVNITKKSAFMVPFHGHSSI